MTKGLYSPEYEHDACGVGFVATLRGYAGHDIVTQALVVLKNLDHRGAVGAEEDSGDGAGILTHMPDSFFRRVAGFPLPQERRYAAGIAYLAQNPVDAQAQMNQIEGIASEEGIEVLGWRDVPVQEEIVGPSARRAMPRMMQLFIADPARELEAIELDRLAYRLLKRARHEADVYFCSLASRTIVYKGMLTTEQLSEFFPDLGEEDYVSQMALVHSRFSTNTFPSWELAQPFSMMAHNGEINTIRGNRNWMSAREGQLKSANLGDIGPLLPICTEGESDSASFNAVLELLYLAGRSLPRVGQMMVPEAWEQKRGIPDQIRALYEFNSALIEPWDGPASITFTDGDLVGSMLDRNGLRPGRFYVTDDDLVVVASEAGVLDIDPARVVRKGRLRPGEMFLVDLKNRRLLSDAQVKAELAAEHPYREWWEDNSVQLAELPEREHVEHSAASIVRRQEVFGYSEEELQMILAPMGTTGAEPLGSMGTDTPIAVLSSRPRLLFDYFSQIFAQVTNPPLDAIREKLVTSLSSAIGPEPNLLDDTADHARKLLIPFPVIDNDQLAKIVKVRRYHGRNSGFTAHVVRGLYPVGGGGEALEARLQEIFDEVDAAMDGGVSVIVLSDRESNAEMAPIPSLLLTSAVHHHLLRKHSRTRVSLVVEAGDVREVHHVALLIGYGAACVNPYLAMESVERLAKENQLGSVGPEKAVSNLIKALGNGVLKVMSKMGISTVMSYRGAQVFQATGLGAELVAKYFTGTASPLGGVGLDVIAEEVLARHRQAYPLDGNHQPYRDLEVGGEYKWRREGPPHLFDPEAIATLQHSTRTENYDLFKRYSAHINDQQERLMTIRGLFELKDTGRQPVPLDEVESWQEIVKRFCTGAMSYGSISAEAHENLAIAMNRIGAKSNTGEGGEDEDRLHDPARRSAIKQVASGRFGVTADYLANADDIQIKLAQGAKPGEGGQLPGPKVYPWVAKTRKATPGVGLISPPPHHDIYSIEDLKQLIHDLKNANPAARIHVKLVSEVGVGTIAAGVSKAHGDVVLISGHDGGTGASPLTSIKHAGAPWELGLAETQQTLVLNNLRDRIAVQVDGQLKTGWDVIVGALLGGEEFGFATAPLVVQGCILMRVCQKDTCPAGIATQSPELRKKFAGTPEQIITFFRYIAEEVREYLAAMGFRKLEDIIGHVEYLATERAVKHWKASGLDLEPILSRPLAAAGTTLHQSQPQDHGLELALDQDLMELASAAIEQGEPVRIERQVRNTNRTVGTMLSHRVVSKWGGDGLPEGTIDITLRGSAGQSLGAFLARGITVRVYGDANDYVAKGLSGGRVVLRPDPEAPFAADDNVIAGNVLAYGATDGELFARGLVGERFAVRNSGATVVAEGVGDHALEYMTGGTAVILGKTGRNFGAGMSGGVAYVLDLEQSLISRTELLAGDLLLDPLAEADLERLQGILQDYVAETGSERAAELLAEPTQLQERFTRVLPAQYARMRNALTQAEEQGIDAFTQEGWERILEVANG